MAQNHRSRARHWTGVPLPNGPLAPLVAIGAILATVLLVANGQRLGGEAPAVPDGRSYAIADAPPSEARTVPVPDDREGQSSASPEPEPAGDGDGESSAGPESSPAADREGQSATGPEGEPTAHGKAAPARRSSARPRRRAPATSHRKRRSSRGRPRAPLSRAQRVRHVNPHDGTPSAPKVGRSVPPVVRRPSTPHRAAISSAEREFGP